MTNPTVFATVAAIEAVKVDALESVSTGSVPENAFAGTGSWLQPLHCLPADDVLLVQTRILNSLNLKQDCYITVHKQN